LDRKLDGPQNRCGCYGEEKISSLCWELNRGHSVCGLVSVPTELSPFRFFFCVWRIISFTYFSFSQSFILFVSHTTFLSRKIRECIFLEAERRRYFVHILSISIPLASTWSIGHPWNASFHFSFLIIDRRQDSLDGGSARRKAATYTGHLLILLAFI
jgi:hypothetical protein